MSFSAVPSSPRIATYRAPDAICLLELALQAAAAELEPGRVAGAAGIGGEPERLGALRLGPAYAT